MISAFGPRAEVYARGSKLADVRLTCRWRVRGTENFSVTADSTPELQRIYDELHPRQQRPEIQRRRRETLEHMATRTRGVVAFPPTLFVPR